MMNDKCLRAILGMANVCAVWGPWNEDGRYAVIINMGIDLCERGLAIDPVGDEVAFSQFYTKEFNYLMQNLKDQAQAAPRQAAPWWSGWMPRIPPVILDICWYI